jgi:DNA-binding transcriptional MerR regulator
VYTIAEAARRAGVSVPVLRAWERRYGAVAPQRTESGYRLYGDEDIARVRAIRTLVDEGWTPSAASARVAAEGVPTELATAEVPRTAVEPTRPLPEPLVAAFVDAAGRLDQAGLAAILDDMFARASFERVTGDLLMPALEALGDAWAEGVVGVAGEHAASHAVLRRLAAAFEAAGAGAADRRARGGSGPIIVGLPPGSRHELGALAFAVTARRAGLPVLYLGPDLPVDDWVRAAGERRDPGRARAAVIAVPTAADRPAAGAVGAALRAARRDLVVAFGGRGTNGAAPGADGPEAPPSASVGGEMLALPDRIPLAVQALSIRLARPGRRDARPNRSAQVRA